MQVLSKDIHQNSRVIDELLGYEKTFDVTRRELIIQEKLIYLYSLNELVDSNQIIKIITSLIRLNDSSSEEDFFGEIINNINHESINCKQDINEICQDFLSGLLVIIVEGANQAITIETRSYPTRSIEEPDMEKVIRGPHDGFTESLATNISLLRRRVKDGKLRNILYDIGEITKTTICLSYIEGICKPSLLNEVQKRIADINVDHLLMSDKALEEILLSQKLNPYPLVRYTERADTVSVHLYQGMIALFVDTSPSVILAPASFFDHLHHTEEYRQTPLAGTYLRFLRFLGVFVALFLTPVALLFFKGNIPMPAQLAFLIPPVIGINLFWQLMIGEVGIEFLRMASIHTPTALSTAMGIIAGLILGDLAIEIGIFTEATVLLVAISAIGTYITPSYELGLANKLAKLFFLVSAQLFGLIGFIISVLIWVITLSSMKSFNEPYFYPFIPFNYQSFKKVIFRAPYHNKK